MEKKKSKLWKLVRVTLYLLLALLVTASLLIWLMLLGMKEAHKEEQRECDNNIHQPNSRCGSDYHDGVRDSFARSINDDILRHHKQKGFYPRSLNDLPITKTEEYSKYRKGIWYSSGMKNNTPFYKLSWIASSPWNGMECSAGIKPAAPSGHEPTEGEAKPVQSSCYMLDLH